MRTMKLVIITLMMAVVLTGCGVKVTEINISDMTLNKGESETLAIEYLTEKETTEEKLASRAGSICCVCYKSFCTKGKIPCYENMRRNGSEGKDLVRICRSCGKNSVYARDLCKSCYYRAKKFGLKVSPETLASIAPVKKRSDQVQAEAIELSFSNLRLIREDMGYGCEL